MLRNNYFIIAIFPVFVLLMIAFDGKSKGSDYTGSTTRNQSIQNYHDETQGYERIESTHTTKRKRRAADSLNSEVSFFK